MGKLKWKLKNLSFINLIISTIKSKPKIKYPLDKKYILDSGKEIISTDYCLKDSTFILIKPSGLRHKDKIIRLLTESGVKIRKELTISDYRSLAKQMFTNVKDEEQNYWFYILENYYDKLNHNKAILLLVESMDLERLGRIKRSIRKKVGIDFYKIYLNNKWQETSLTPIHSPDDSRIDYEFKIAIKFVD